MSEKKVTVPRYPNAFLYGFVSGAMIQLAARAGTMEPLCARPFSYLRLGLVFGVSISYWDYWRRTAMQQVMYGEERQKYHKTVKAINNSVRYGEEDDIQNLTEYLAGYSLRV
jgi:hypothetical protein